MSYIHPYICELCHIQLLTTNELNRGKFPVTRIFENNDPTGKLLTIRCVECNEIPYWLKEGNPSRADLFNRDDVTILQELNRNYNYWSHGIKHLFELYTDYIDEKTLVYFRETPIELGYLVDEEVNLIILAHRFISRKWMVTPFQWHFYWEFARDYPPLNPVEKTDREFKIAFINGKGGKYLVIRNEILSFEFAEAFHRKIYKQIESGPPQDIDLYRSKVRNLYELLLDDDLDSKIEARTILGTPQSDFTI